MNVASGDTGGQKAVKWLITLYEKSVRMRNMLIHYLAQTLK